MCDITRINLFDENDDDDDCDDDGNNDNDDNDVHPIRFNASTHRNQR